jgi:tetratricopeptide (TPR) repeat protein
MGDQITVGGKVEGVGIAMGANASVNIMGDVNYYPIKLRAPLRNVFKPLIEERTKLFGGRSTAFTSIASFIHNTSSGYLVVTAPAGFGKTALIANLVDRTPDAFAYHFFAPLDWKESLNEECFLRNALEQMAQWHGYKEELPDSLNELSALYQKLVDEALEKTQVLILDGLDEVTQWKLAPYLSRRLPENLHFILTVRDVGQDWASDYNVPADQIVHLPLGGLTREDVAQVLRAAGHGAITFAEDAKLLEEVMRVSAYQADETLGADPFYVRLLAEDAADGSLTPENIVGQPKGLNSYLDRWWQEVKQMAGDTPARDLFGTLTVALGWISRADLEALNPSLVDAWAADFFDEVIHKIRRFVAYDESQGYAIAHPRLRQYMRTKIKTDAYHEKLLAYCAAWQKHYSPYALKHYARHLAEAGKGDKLYRLITKAWMDAKFKQTYSHRAFAEDVELSIKTAAADESLEGLVTLMRNCLIFATLRSQASLVPPQLLGLLVLTGDSAKALDYAELIEENSEKSEAYGLLGDAMFSQGEGDQARRCLSRGLAAAKAIPSSWPKATALEKLVQVLAKAWGKDGLNEAIVVAETIEWVEAWAEALGEIAQALTQIGEESRAREVVDRILAVAEEVQDEPAKAELLSGAAYCLAILEDEGRATEVASQALAVSEKTKSWNLLNIRAMSKMIRVVTRVGDESAVERALAVVDSFSKLGQLALFGDIVECFTERKGKDGVNAALDLAQGIDDEDSRAHALAEVTAAMAPLTDEFGLTESLAVANMIGNPRYKVRALSKLAQCRAEIGDREGAAEVAKQALGVMASIQDEDQRVTALGTVTLALTESADKVGLSKALAVAEAIQDEKHRANALGAVAQALSKIGERTKAAEVATLVLSITKSYHEAWRKGKAIGDAVHALTREPDHSKVNHALTLADSIQDEWYRAEALGKVAQTLAKTGDKRMAIEVANRALLAATALKSESDKARRMSDLLPVLTQIGERNLLYDASSKAEGLQDTTGWKETALYEVAQALATVGDREKAAELANRLLAKAETLKDESSRADILSGVAKAFAQAGDVEGLGKVFRIAEMIEQGEYRVKALSRIADSLMKVGRKEQATEVANQAMAIVEMIPDEDSKATALKETCQALALLGDRNALGRELAVAHTIEDEFRRGEALKGVVLAMVQLGDNEALDKALAVTEEIRYEIDRTDALLEVARSLAKAGDRERAIEVLNQSLSTAQTISDESLRASRLIKVCEVLAQLGNKEALDRVLAVAEAIKDEEYRAEVLGEVAWALTQTGNFKRGSEAFRLAFNTARLAGQDKVFDVLGHQLRALGATGQWQTFWDMYEAMNEVEGWWSTK